MSFSLGGLASGAGLGAIFGGATGGLFGGISNMFKSPSTPTPPNPYAVSDAETQANKSTALYNTQLNRYGTSGPGGSTSWTSTPGVNGAAPSWNQTTTLSPDQQNLYDTGNQAKKTALSNALTSVGSPIPQADANLRSQYQDAILSRVNPKQTWQTESMNSDLANQGIDPNSNPAAYERAMKPLIWQQNDEQNQAFLNAGTEEANQLGLQNQQRDLPINELNALQTGTQVQMPGQPQPQPFGASPPSTANNFGNQYTGLQDIYNQQVGQQNATTSGLFGLGGAGLMGLMMSDKRLKTDIRKVGETDEGTNIYLYRFKGDQKTQMGVMAQEVEETNPEAVHNVQGIKMVDYSMVQ